MKSYICLDLKKNVASTKTWNLNYIFNLFIFGKSKNVLLLLFDSNASAFRFKPIPQDIYRYVCNNYSAYVYEFYYSLQKQWIFKHFRERQDIAIMGSLNGEDLWNCKSVGFNIYNKWAKISQWCCKWISA